MRGAEAYTLRGADVRRLLGIGRTKLYELVAAGALHPINVGSEEVPRYRFSEIDVQDYQNRQLKNPESRPN